VLPARPVPPTRPPSAAARAQQRTPTASLSASSAVSPAGLRSRESTS
jgi:hypothetical protein